MMMMMIRDVRQTSRLLEEHWAQFVSTTAALLRSIEIAIEIQSIWFLLWPKRREKVAAINQTGYVKLHII